jgi:alkylhydroperoxidase family enzyme
LLRIEPDPTGALELSEAQRAAVGYAEQYALDPHGLRDSDFDAMHRYCTDAQLATLTLAVAMYDALARFSVALEV